MCLRFEMCAQQPQAMVYRTDLQVVLCAAIDNGTSF